MKKLLLAAALIISTNVVAEAAEKKLTLIQQIQFDSERDPYAESTSAPTIVEIETEVITEEYVEPEAAEQMKPSKHFELKNGNTVVK